MVYIPNSDFSGAPKFFYTIEDRNFSTRRSSYSMVRFGTGLNFLADRIVSYGIRADKGYQQW